MKRALAKLIFILVTTATLSGCIWWVEDEGHHRGHYEERHEHGGYGEHEGGERH